MSSCKHSFGGPVWNFLTLSCGLFYKMCSVLFVYMVRASMWKWNKIIVKKRRYFQDVIVMFQKWKSRFESELDN